MVFSPERPFCHAFRVRFSECDPQGVVFNSRYLEYADVVLTEFWRAMGISGAADGDLHMHAARALVEYRAPIRPDEVIEGRAWIARIGTSSLTTRIDLHGAALPGPDQAGTHDLRAEIELVHVRVDLATNRARPLSARHRQIFGG